MDTLLAEKKKRGKELELLHSSKSKLQEELHNMQIFMERMRSEMIDFQNLENLRRNFDNTKSLLVEQKQGYIRRKDAMRQHIQSASAEYEVLLTFR